MTSSLELEDEDGFTKIVDLDVPRVDLVDRAANGTHFLLTKSEESADAGLLSTDQVRALAKASTELEEPPVSDPVVKDNLDPTETLVGDSPAASTPSSPEWEQVDHDTAQKFISILNFAQYAITELAGREAQEGVAGADDGWENEWNLEDAACAIEYARGILAVYAAGEKGDIEISEEMEKASAIVKALQPLAEFDIVGTQSAVAVRKSGRVLSAKNETLLRDAAEALTKVLGSLPLAPETEETVTKNDESVEVEKTEGEEVTEPVVKADDDTTDDTDDQLVVVFDSNKNILGVVPESAIQPVKGAAAPEAEAETPAAPAAEDTTAAPKADAGIAADVAKGEEPDAAEGDFTKELAELRELVKSQAEDIKFLKSPAKPRVAMNGVTPKGPMPLPQNDRQTTDVEKSEVTEEEIDVLKAAALTGTVAEQEAAKNRLTEITAASWQDLRAQAASRFRR
jgi:hypothetical protein